MMHLKGKRWLASALLALLPASASAQNPETGELSVVFPRNDTYAVVSPFPVVLGFHQSNALLYYATSIDWQLECANGTLFGLGHMYGDDEDWPSSVPYFYTNASYALGDQNEDGDSFPYWKGETDSCTLSWEFKFLVECEYEDDGSKLIKTGYYPTQTGSVNFTLAIDGTLPHDAISDYEGCPEAGIAVRIEDKDDSCAIVDGDGLVDTKPCDLDVAAAASSLADKVATATTTLTELTSTTEPASTTTTSDSAAETTGSGDGNGENSNGGSGSGGDGEGLGIKATMSAGLMAASVVGSWIWVYLW
jgi:hypothetical protein